MLWSWTRARLKETIDRFLWSDIDENAVNMASKAGQFQTRSFFTKGIMKRTSLLNNTDMFTGWMRNNCRPQLRFFHFYWTRVQQHTWYILDLWPRLHLPVYTCTEDINIQVEQEEKHTEIISADLVEESVSLSRKSNRTFSADLSRSFFPQRLTNEASVSGWTTSSCYLLFTSLCFIFLTFPFAWGCQKKKKKSYFHDRKAKRLRSESCLNFMWFQKAISGAAVLRSCEKLRHTPVSRCVTVSEASWQQRSEWQRRTKGTLPNRKQAVLVPKTIQSGTK